MTQLGYRAKKLNNVFATVAITNGKIAIVRFSQIIYFVNFIDIAKGEIIKYWIISLLKYNSFSNFPLGAFAKELMQITVHRPIDLINRFFHYLLLFIVIIRLSTSYIYF